MKWLHEERDAYLLGLARVLFGVLLAIQVWQRFEELAHWGYFGAFFHLPLVPESWVPSLGVYQALLGVELLGAALAVSGWRGREGLFVGSSVGLFLMLCDRLGYHNNRFSLFLFCLLCAFCPSDRSFLLYRGKAHALPTAERLGPTLLRRLMAFQVSLLYLSSGGGKALDPDWRSGQTMLLRFREGVELALRSGSSIPPWLESVLTSSTSARLASVAAISLELSLAVLLWLPRTRVFACWAGAIFHLSIQLSARVELFSWIMGVAYLAFVTPELRERVVRVDLATSAGRLTARLLPLIDWLARFRVEAVPAGTVPAPGLEVVDRDGSRATGRGVAAALARSVPVAFLVWPVLALLSPRNRDTGASARAVGSPAGPG